MKRILVLATLSVAAVTAVTASAQESTTARDGARMIQRVEARLGITPAQAVEFKAILQREKPALQAIHSQLAAEHAELLKATTFNEAETEAIVAKYAAANTQQMVEREKLRMEIVAILTPEQKQKLDRLRARFGAGVEGRMLAPGDSL